MIIEEKLKQLGIEIPDAPKPLAAYIPAVRTGNLVFTSGQLPFLNGELQYRGKVGGDVSVDDAKAAAKLCAINCLSAVKSVIGSLDEIARVVKITAFIASADGFTNQPEVANGASGFMLEVFGDAGRHSRGAVGVSELPRGACVEIETVFEIK